MNIFEKIRCVFGEEVYYKELYKHLCDEKFNTYPFSKRDLGEEMTLIEESIWGWFKPRFLIDNINKRACEFMTTDFKLLTLTDEDIDWDSLKTLSDNLIQMAKSHNGHYPTLIYSYHNGIAQVEWQLNPDGYYYMDSDGFGMTDDVKVALYGYVNRSGKVVKKFSYKHNAELM